MFGFSIWHLLVVLIIVLIIFGGSKLPEIGAGLGKGISNFKEGLQGTKKMDNPPDKEKPQLSSGDDQKPSA
ncbi:MAG: twin-arginine translocase TatA/TatE family subunit [Deltaproteobacteria bacterium]|nr:twin-arginine translocase TatA/TatE family subunit [Deltaproteobacteria bacterium]